MQGQAAGHGQLPPATLRATARPAPVRADACRAALPPVRRGARWSRGPWLALVLLQVTWGFESLWLGPARPRAGRDDVRLRAGPDELAEAENALQQARARLEAAKTQAESEPGEATPAADKAADGAAEKGPRANFAALAEAFLDSREDAKAAEARAPPKSRPSRLLESMEARALLEVFVRLEEVDTMGEETALGLFFQAVVAALYRFVPADPQQAAKLESLPEGARKLPADLQRELLRTRSSISPEMLLLAFVGLDGKGSARGGEQKDVVVKDWRPLARALCSSPRLAELVEAAAPWERLFPDALERGCGVRRSEVRAAAAAFARLAARERPGSWEAEEIAEAERLAEEPRRAKVLARAVKVMASMGGVVKAGVMAFAWIPVAIVALIALAAAAVFALSAGNNPEVPVRLLVPRCPTWSVGLISDEWSSCSSSYRIIGWWLLSVLRFAYCMIQWLQLSTK